MMVLIVKLGSLKLCAIYAHAKEHSIVSAACSLAKRIGRMKKWIGRLVALGIFGFIGYGVYDYYRAGLHTRPEMPPGAFSISFKSGFRAILVDIPNEKDTRRYFGLPTDVPFYLEDAWSFCNAPNDQEIDEYKLARPGTLERFDAICQIEVDETSVPRGIIVSVPRL
jgi:hypothetical protein